MKIFLAILAILLVFLAITACTKNQQKFAASAAIDAGISHLHKEVPSVNLRVPVQQLDGGVYQTPLGFLHFSVVQTPDTIFITAFPQYSTITDTLKSFVNRKIEGRKKKQE